MRKIFTCLLIIMFGVSHAQAQDKTVTGTVFDETGSPLMGATVLIKGTSTGLATGLDGTFGISVKSTDVLIITYIGFEDQEISIGDKSEFEIYLISKADQLDDVVVIGYQKVHKKDVISAVSSIGSEQIENIPVISVSSLLASQSTGVQQVTLSGAPGARGGIVIRGNTSISTNLDADTAYSNPLYVIDGVQTSLEDLAGYNVSNVDYLASLNPNDIQSIDILKDASAAAIYGSRGANGVIIITTKGGKALDKPEFQFSSSVGFQPKPELVSMLVGSAERRAKMDMIEKWWSNDHQFNGSVPMVLSDSLNPAFNNNVDYQGLFYQPGVTQKYNVSMRGGSNETNYRVALGYDNQKGVVKNTGFERFTLATTLNSKVGKRFENTLRINTVFTDNKTGQGNPYIGGQSAGSFGLNSNLPVSPAGLNSSLFYLSDDVRKSIQGELSEKRNTDQAIQLSISDFLKYNITDNLSFNTQLTFVYSNNKKNFYEPSIIRDAGNGFASASTYSRKNASTDTYLSYFKEVGDHQITGIAGFKTDYNQYEDMALSAVGYGSDAIQVINGRYAKDEISGYTDISANSLLTYFGRFSYKYKDKYLLSASFSRDGSSRFGEDVRWANFPSISAAWILTEESFISDHVDSFIDFAKVKFTYGINGKQFPNNYLRFGAYSLGYGGTPFGTNQMDVSSYGGVSAVIPNYSSIGNSSLSWEESRQWDFGFELDMFNYRLSASFEAYNKQTNKLFFDIQFPNYSGYNSAKANVAGILNYGWETMIRYHVFPRDNDLTLELGLGFTHNENYITDLPNGGRDYEGTNYGYTVGLPINLYKMFINDYIIDDLNQLPVNPFTGQPLVGKSAWAAIRPGFPIWKDLNGDYLLDEAGDLHLATEYSPLPDLLGSFNINLKYKSWYLQMYSQFSFGADILNTVTQAYTDRYDRGGAGWAQAGLADLSDFYFWEQPGDGAAGARYPAIYPTGAGTGGPWYGFRGNQSLWIESGDYWKITNAAIGYNVTDEGFLNNLGLSRMRVFASVLNPWMWQRSKAVVDASMVDAKGHTYGNGYPQARTISLGIDVKF